MEAQNEARVAKVISKNMRVSPRKLNLLAQQIRGKTIQNAMDVMAFSEKRVAVDVRKALKALVANAENNHYMDIDRLIVKEAYVGKSITLKRFSARAKGRGVSIHKPFSHLTITACEVEA